MSCRICQHGKARHNKRVVACRCCFEGVYGGATNEIKPEEPKLADSDKIIVEVTPTLALKTEPTYEWWICWRDKPEDKEFKCVTVDTPEQVSREVDRLGQELNGRCIWVTALMGAYRSEIMVKMLPISNELAKMGCVN
jgi:hypothetical protein